MDWRPIDTAPKDGTLIDGWLDCDHCESYRITEMVWKKRKGWCDWCWPESDFCSVEGPYSRVTHWMPVPEPPTK